MNNSRKKGPYKCVINTIHNLLKEFINDSIREFFFQLLNSEIVRRSFTNVMSEKTKVWKTMPLATAVLMSIEKRQGVILDDELANILSMEFGDVSKAEINQVLMNLEIRGLVHVSFITKNKRRIERIKDNMLYMAVGED